MQTSYFFTSLFRVTAKWMLILFLTSNILFQFRLFFFEEPDLDFQAQTAALHPIFEGWYSNEDGATCSLDFGYKNDNAVTVSVPIGGNNFFRPSPQNQGQPTKFLPGRQRHVFRIVVPANYSGNKLWTLAYAGSRETCTALLNPALKIEPVTVNAGPDQIITLPAAAQLQGTYTDLVAGGTPVITWSKVSGPGIASFLRTNVPVTSVTFSSSGDYILRLTVADGQIVRSDDIVIKANPSNQAPQVSAGPDQTVTLPNAAALAGSGTDDGLPVGSTLTFNWSIVTGPGMVVFGNSGAAVTTASFDIAGNYVLMLTASDSLLASTDVVAITVNPAGPVLPPDPSTVAPPIDRTVTTTVAHASEFLYTGESPIQTGIVPGTIEPVRAAVLRGKIIQRDGLPLPGVKIQIKDHAEYGSTLSRSDGMFDLAVNGGSLLTVNFEKAGYPLLQREVSPPWQDYGWLPQVAMIPFDSQVSTVQVGPSSPIQIARGNLVTDENGSRRATLLFPAAVLARLEMSDGTSQPIDALNIRLTEYTLGPRGPMAMPGSLPPQSAYTYCVEISADEALAAGAKSVRFSQPVIQYVDNYLGFSPGAIVPQGYYDRDKAAWVASESGRVIHMLSIVDGQAVLDVEGNNSPATPEALVSLGITGPEQQSLAGLFQPGQSFWRIPIPHFTAWDSNWGMKVPEDATVSGAGSPKLMTRVNKPDCVRGSVIECQNQVLHEDLRVTGTPFRIHYASDRVPGRKSAKTMEIPISGSTVSGSLKRIDVVVEVGGQRYVSADGLYDYNYGQPLGGSFQPLPNQMMSFTWDGKDGYGRVVQGSQPVRVRVGYVYDGVYAGVNRFGYNGEGIPITFGKTLQEVVLWREWQSVLSLEDNAAGTWDARALALGGWSLNVHHVYDPMGRILFYGDGSRRTAYELKPVISTVSGTGVAGYNGDGGMASQAQLNSPRSVAVHRDGSLYIAERNSQRIRKVASDGTISTVAGTGTAGYSGDGGIAIQAQLRNPSGVALGPDESVYIADSGNSRIRKIDKNGIISTLAGNGTLGYSGDGGPAVQAQLILPQDMAVAPDGSVYIADSNNSSIRRVGLDGIISTVAGTGVNGISSDGIPANQAQFQVLAGIALGPDGSLFLAETFNNRIRRVRPDGLLSTAAGNGFSNSSGDGGPATEAGIKPSFRVAVASDGSLYIAETQGYRIRRVSPEGIITTVSGTGSPGFSGDAGPAAAAEVNSPNGVAIGPDNSIYIADTSNQRVRKISLALPGVSMSEFAIPSEDGGEVYIFDRDGRHLRTVDAMTLGLRYQFNYDNSGLLAAIVDGDNNVTAIERGGSGNATAIVGPYGDRTTLTLNQDQYLASISNPANETTQFTYDADGLLLNLTNPQHNTYQFTYDSLGLLNRDEDPAGGFTSLIQNQLVNGLEVVRSNSLNEVTTHRVETLTAGGELRTNLFPDGTQTSTVIGTDGGTSTNLPDGTSTSMLEGPDPRFGMQASLAKNQTLSTPGGLTSNTSHSRSTTLANTNDPLSLMAQTDTLVVNGRTYVQNYNAVTRTYTNTTPTGRQSAATVDNLGRIVQSQIASLEPARFSYDSRGRLFSAAVGSGVQERRSNFTYNPSGYLETVTDPLHRTVRFNYDQAGRVVSQLLPDNRMIGFAYDANGNLTSVTPPGRPQHAFEYTEVDLTKSYVPPNVGAESNVTNYTYNTERRPTRILRPDGQAIDFDYDSAGRLRNLNLPGEQFDYTYQPVSGNLGSILTSSGEMLSYGYDGFLPVHVGWTGTISGSVDRVFDHDFRLSTQTINGSASFNFSYDPDSLLIQAGALSVTHDSQNGLITGTTLGNVGDAYSYNGFAEPIAYTASTGGSPVYAVTYERDVLGRISDKTETLEGVTNSTHYTYDVAGRLETVSKNGSLASSYNYDSNGNRLNRTSITGLTSYTYDDQDRLVSLNSELGTQSFVYSANGELQSRSKNAEVIVYQYDVLGNLRHIGLPDGTLIDYVIDGQNRRVGKKLNGVLVQGWLYGSQLNPVAELDGNSNVVSTFIYASRSNVPDYLVKNGVTYRILSDQLGSPRLVVEAMTGAVVQRMDYDEFGMVLNDTSPGFQPFGFAGGLYDAQAGLVRFGARDYDPETGRWTAKDPILFAGGITNLYGYLLNDPVNFADPMGLWSPEGHDSFIEHALGRIAPYDVMAIQLGSRFIDETTQANQFAHIHSTRQAGESTTVALRKRDAYIRKKLNEARCFSKSGDRVKALYTLGEGLHPLMDSISPPHLGPSIWNTYDPRTWIGHSPFEGFGFENKSDITEDDYKIMDKFIFESYLYVFN